MVLIYVDYSLTLSLPRNHLMFDERGHVTYRGAGASLCPQNSCWQ